jgi:hypothetical protein
VTVWTIRYSGGYRNSSTPEEVDSIKYICGLFCLSALSCHCADLEMGKGKAIPLQALTGP